MPRVHRPTLKLMGMGMGTRWSRSMKMACIGGPCSLGFTGNGWGGRGCHARGLHGLHCRIACLHRTGVCSRACCWGLALGGGWWCC